VGFEPGKSRPTTNTLLLSPHNTIRKHGIAKMVFLNMRVACVTSRRLLDSI